MPGTGFPLIGLDRRSFVPYYRQIANQVKEIIQCRGITPGQRFWSEGEIGRRLGVSKMTVRQAFQLLRADGLLVVEKGKRPAVGSARIRKDFQKLRGFSEEMARSGFRASSKLLAAECIFPDAQTAQALSLNKGEKVYKIVRLRFANDEIVGLEVSHIPAGLFPDLLKQDLATNSLYSTMEKLYNVRLAWSHEELKAVPAKKEEAKLLQVACSSPLFSMRRTVYNAEDKPIEYGHSLFRGDRYSATVISRREF
jgi:GntR family transcriptional regulator